MLNVLHSLVEKSSINRQLEVYTSGGGNIHCVLKIHMGYLRVTWKSALKV